VYECSFGLMNMLLVMWLLQPAKLSRFTIDRTPLQRMLVAAVLHANLPDGDFVPEASNTEADLRKSDGRTAHSMDTYKEWRSPAGKLPDRLFESAVAVEASEDAWHSKCAAGPVQHADVDAVERFVSEFKLVLFQFCLGCRRQYVLKCGHDETEERQKFAIYSINLSLRWFLRNQEWCPLMYTMDHAFGTARSTFSSTCEDETHCVP
jgi:hypothetical protein